MQFNKASRKRSYLTYFSRLNFHEYITLRKKKEKINVC